MYDHVHNSRTGFYSGNSISSFASPFPSRPFSYLRKSSITNIINLIIRNRYRSNN